jgi:hypothetical protein
MRTWDEALSWSRTVDRRLVHRSSAAEVFLTDVRPSGPDQFAAAALWPRSHPTFPRGRDDRHSPLLIVETLRQLGIYLPLRHYGVARDARLLIRDLAFDLDPAAEPRAGYGATEVVCLAEVGKLRREGPGLPPVGLRLTVRYLSGGREFARATGGARFAAPARYAELRGAGTAAAGPVLPAPAVLAPAVLGTSPSTAGPNGTVPDAPAPDAAAPDPAAPDGAPPAGPPPNGRNGSNIVSDSPPRTTPAMTPTAPCAPIAPRPGPAEVAVSSPSDVLVALADGLVLIDPADPLHPFFFDHPSDHVPGMALLEAARQSAALASGGRLLRPVGARLRAMRFTEARPAAAVECVDHGLTCVFRVRQGGGVTACGVLRYGARPGA